MPRDQWVTVYDRIRELLALVQTPDFMRSLKEALTTSTEEKKEGQEEEEDQAEMLEMLES